MRHRIYTDLSCCKNQIKTELTLNDNEGILSLRRAKSDKFDRYLVDIWLDTSQKKTDLTLRNEGVDVFKDEEYVNQTLVEGGLAEALA